MLTETKHDYNNCITGNFFSNEASESYPSWVAFKEAYCIDGSYDDTYDFVFRYDIHNDGTPDIFTLELCIMQQRKGIYKHLFVKNITQEELNTEVEIWLANRYEYMKRLWIEMTNRGD